MTTDGARVAPHAVAIVGVVVLALAGGVTFVLGVLVDLLGDACGAGKVSESDVLHCRNVPAAAWLLMATPLVVTPGAVLLTWLRPNGTRPRAWAPFLGIGVLAVAWVLVYAVVPVI